jgi:penicillin-binding protein 1A
MTTRRALTLAAGLAAATAVTAYLLAGILAAAEFTHIAENREHLPDLGPFTRFEFPTVGHVYDASDTPLIELAREYREITPYEQIPPVVRDAILAAEDKRFFAHDGIDYHSVPRVLTKVRGGMLMERLLRGGHHDEPRGAALFPQGGSTITQQLVRGVFLRGTVAGENSYQLRATGLTARALASLIGARGVNMLARKREEMRLSLWLEQEMQIAFGSKRRAKEEILARYASFVYMGNGQYGFARAARYYFGRPLITFAVADADKAALLAGIAKSPRDYAPNWKDPRAAVQRRNQPSSFARRQSCRCRRANPSSRTTRRFRASGVHSGTDARRQKGHDRSCTGSFPEVSMNLPSRSRTDN